MNSTTDGAITPTTRNDPTNKSDALEWFCLIESTDLAPDATYRRIPANNNESEGLKVHVTMDSIAIPDWVRQAPGVLTAQDWHLPQGSGISGPPAGAFLTMVQSENSLMPHPMWQVLLEVTEADIALLT